jgi:hypothetical protein
MKAHDLDELVGQGHVDKQFMVIAPLMNQSFPSYRIYPAVGLSDHALHCH